NARIQQWTIPVEEKRKKSEARSLAYIPASLPDFFSHQYSFSLFDGPMGRQAEVVATAVVVVVVVVGMIRGSEKEMTWCVARSEAGAMALQAEMDQVCSSGVADCAPVQPSGLCYLPNTLPSHASYAFNSYYQRSNANPAFCDFHGTATITVLNPSYGSCSYPSSVSACLGCSTAGGSVNTPNTGGGGGGLNPPVFGSMVPAIDMAVASHLCHPLLLAVCLCFVSLLF
ncbi:hypothetical protein BHE74_00009756, partial [Ensete ventricosum]